MAPKRSQRGGGGAGGPTGPTDHLGRPLKANKQALQRRQAPAEDEVNEEEKEALMEEARVAALPWWHRACRSIGLVLVGIWEFFAVSFTMVCAPRARRAISHTPPSMYRPSASSETALFACVSRDSRIRLALHACEAYRLPRHARTHHALPSRQLTF